MYYPLFEEVFVYRNLLRPEHYVTLVIRDHDTVLTNDRPTVVIDGEEYVYDQDGTEKTRMFMRVHAQQREEAEAAAVPQ